MKELLAPLEFRQTLPSAVSIFIVGFVLSMFAEGWTFYGYLDVYAWPLGVGLGVVIYGCGFLFTCTPKLITTPMRELLQTLHNLFHKLNWFQIVVLSLLAGIGEELLIRGVLQSWLVNNSNPLIGVITASLIFGLLHYMTKTYVLLTFGLGLLFGAAFHFSESIVLVIVAHIVYDLIAFAMIVKFPHMLGLHSANEKISIINQR